jgi:hypothetical protein
MIREYSSISVETTLSAQMTSVQTTMNVAAGTGSALLGGISLSPAGTYQFTLAIDPDTANEEIVFATGSSGDTFTVVRGQAQSTAITHAAGATVRHVLTASDLDYFNTAVQPSTLTAKGDTYVATAASTVTRLAVGSNGQVLTADSTETKGMKWATPATGSVTSITAGTGLSGGTITTTGTIAIDSTVATLAGTQTLTNKTVTDPVLVETVNAQTGTTYTPVLTDASKMVTLSNASAITVTIPPASSVAYTAGSKIDFIAKGAGQVSFAQGSGVTIRSTGATATAPKLRVQYSAATAWYEGSDVWYIVGDLA